MSLLDGNFALNSANTNYLSSNMGFATNNNLLSPFSTTANYSDDILMPSFLKTGFTSFTGNNTSRNLLANETNASVPAQNQPASVFQQEIPTAQQQQIMTTNLDMFNRKLAQQNPNIRITKNGNIYLASNSGKKVGIWGGLLTTIGTGLYKFAKTGQFTPKNLLIKAPVFAIAGFGIGALADYFKNKNRANIADQASMLA